MHGEHKTAETAPMRAIESLVMAPTVSSRSGGAPKLQRGMKLRSALSGYGIVQNAEDELMVYIIAISPRGSNNLWRVFRRYSDFKSVREELLNQVGI